MTLEPYFIRFCMNQYHISKPVLQEMDTGKCYLCKKKFVNPRRIYLDHDRLRNLNHGLCCRNCYNIRREIYENEDEELHAILRNFMEPETRQIHDIVTFMKKVDALDTFVFLCNEKGYNIMNVKRHLRLAELVFP